MTTRKNDRQGFTLVEMLVSSALIIFVMVILTQVFSIGLTSLRNLRGRGHLQDHIRSAVMTLRRDLAAPHFDKETDALHGPYLSQQRLDSFDWTPPKEGFFRIYQGNAGLATIEDSNQDGTVNTLDADSDGLYSYVATTHYLHFTVRAEPATAQGGGRDRYFSTGSLGAAGLPAPTLAKIAAFSKPEYLANDGIFYSPWSEVAYYLRPTGQFAGSTNLFTLYRRRRILVDGKPGVVAANMASTPIPQGFAGPLSDMSIYDPQTGNVYLNTPADVTAPFRRFGMQPATINQQLPTQAAGLNLLSLPTLRPGTTVPATYSFIPLYDDTRTQNTVGGDDVLLENVISFQVRVSWEIPSDPRIGGLPNLYMPPASTTVNRFMTPTGPVYNPPQKVDAPAAFTPPDPSQPATSPLRTNPDYPFDDLPLSPNNYGNDTLRTANGTLPSTLPARVFDTWSGEDVLAPNSTNANAKIPYSQWNTRYQNGGAPADQLNRVTIPLRIRVKAIQVRIRVWDPKTQQARQVTVVQDL